ncbi:hypothetical protein V499_01644 [Pseudogymnoascus sp. VKM F-103]|nr:hypothetical protein V499_01644 [Pseudogymnoascus sp. VKM F-103]
MLVLEVTLLRTTANCQGDRLFRGVAANAVEGVVCIASRQNRNRLQKTAITPSIPLGSELMAVVSPQGPLPMLDNPNLQASYFMTSHHHAATKPYAQGHESRVGIEKKIPVPWVTLMRPPYKAIKKALRCSHPVPLAKRIGCGWRLEYDLVRYRALNAPMGG